MHSPVMRVMYRIFSTVESLEGKIRKHLAFRRLAALEKNPPTSTTDPRLDQINDPLARLAMNRDEQREFVARMVGLRNHVYDGKKGPVNVIRKILTEGDLEQMREKIRLYEF